MRTPLQPNEHLLKEGPANLQRGIETVGGTLRLTERRLVFESHKQNVQRGDTVLPLKTIATLAKRWTKFANLIPIVPNSLVAITAGGEEYRFILFKRDAWSVAILDAKAALDGAGK